MMSLTKNPHPQPKNFFRVQTRRFAAYFKPLNSSLPLLAPELHAHKATCNLVVLACKSPNPSGRQSVKVEYLFGKPVLTKVQRGYLFSCDSK